LRDRGLQWEENLAEYKTEHDNLRHSWEKIHNEVVQLGGLHILGTERHESRRIDNQLRGRAGRQGDPGSSRFYLSLEDDLMRIFVSERIAGVMQSLGMEEGMPIESRLISRQIERAQKEVEGRNFGIRKHLLEYDDVMNSQRQEIYRFRRELLEGEDQREYILELAREIAVELIDTHAAKDMDPKDWGLEELRINFHRIFAQDLPSNVDELTHGELKDELLKRLQETYKNKEAEIDRLGSGVDTMRWFERNIMLQIIDQQWKDHLLALDHLREGIGLRGYGQRDPLVEYKRESFELFQDLWDRSTEEIVRMIFLLSPVADDSDLQGIPPRPARPLSYSGSASVALPVPNPSGTTPAGIASSVPKVGRNQPCPCGSGKKYKRCHAIER